MQQHYFLSQQAQAKIGEPLGFARWSWFEPMAGVFAIGGVALTNERSAGVYDSGGAPLTSERSAGVFADRGATQHRKSLTGVFSDRGAQGSFRSTPVH